MPDVKLDFGRIERAARAAFRETCLLAHREMIVVISEPGAFDGFPGDIVDTGLLRSSQQPPQFSGDQARFVNTVEYAVVVHEGAEFRAGQSWEVKSHTQTRTQAFGRPIAERQVEVRAHTRTRQTDRVVEGRPWMREALRRLDLQATFDKLLAAKLNR